VENVCFVDVGRSVGTSPNWSTAVWY